MSIHVVNRVETIRTTIGRIDFTYDADGRVAGIAEQSGSGKVVRALTYDAAGRLATESHSAGTTTVTYGSTETTIVDGRSDFGFTRSSGGRVASVDVGSTEFSVSYDGGMVSGFRHGADSVEFRRDDRGRIIGTTFPDGSTRTYAYDALGNRTIARHSLDEAEHYTYDGVGNLVEVSIDSRGVRSTQTYRIGDMLETLPVVCGCLPAEPEPPVSEKDPTCAPCNPPVGTAMYKKHRIHSRGGNHGFEGDTHVHHWEVNRSPPHSPRPCDCFSHPLRASDSIYAGEIRWVDPTGGGIEGC